MATRDAPWRAIRKRASALLGGALLAGLLSACATETTEQGDSYRRYNVFMVDSGRFRTETAPADAPYGSADLVRNFELVAFEPEAQLAQYYPGPSADRRVSKWTGPIRYAIVGDAATDRDRAAFEALAAKLARLTGLDFLPSGPEEATMTIFIVSATARETLDARSRDLPGYRGSVTEAWIRTLNPPCFALFETGAPAGGEIRSAAIFLKGELEDPLRGACLLEETTQSLGLIFDHPIVRPSIFNDDQEFIALTRHDESLIQILYDPRIRPGALRPEAVALAQEIVAERAASFGVE